MVLHIRLCKVLPHFGYGDLKWLLTNDLLLLMNKAAA
jgi:hypothetical protein